MTTMTELGALLRKERELRGLSHEDVSRRIKVAIRTLVALEEGDVEELPHPVYTKGFIKSYARIVGLDPEEMGQAVTEIFAEEMEDLEDAEPVYVNRGVQPSRVQWPLILFILLVLGLAAGGGWYFFFKKPASSLTTLSAMKFEDNASAQRAAAPPEETNSAEAADAAKDAAPVSDAVVPQPDKSDDGVVQEQGATGDLAVPDAPSETPQAVQSTTPSGVTPGIAQDTGLAAPAEPAAKEKTPAVSAVEKPTAAPEKVAAENSAPVRNDAVAGLVKDVVLKKRVGEQKITLSATSECWIEASGEAFEHREMYLRAGQKFVMRFPNDLVLKLGNSGGVSLALNDTAFSFDGAEGKVLTFHFHPER